MTYQLDLFYDYVGSVSDFDDLVQKIVDRAEADNGLQLGKKQRFYKEVVVDCGVAKLTVAANGHRLVV